MKLFYIIWLFFFSSTAVCAQEDAIEKRKLSIRNWQILSTVKFVKSNDGYSEIYLPDFSGIIETFENKEILLQGYIVPNDGLFSAEEFIISSLPLAQCFFCGGDSGPESVAYVYPKNPIEYTAKLVSIKGKLILNRTDSNNLLYLIDDATVEDAE